MARYTADEMREMAIEAEVIEVADQFNSMDTIAAMLRQAADMMDRADSAIRANAKEKVCRHKDADAVLETAKFILGGKLTREKRYEYAERFARSGDVDYRHYDSKNDVEHEREMSSVVVRREVGEWEEVE